MEGRRRRRRRKTEDRSKRGRADLYKDGEKDERVKREIETESKQERTQGREKWQNTAKFLGAGHGDR
jgi:hypothetical protein